MNFFGIDWAGLAAYVPVWPQVSPAARAVLMEMRATDRVEPARFGDERGRLEELGLVRPTTVSGVEWLRLHPDFRLFSKVFRAVEEVPLGDRPDLESFERYCRTNLTHAERDALAGRYRVEIRDLVDRVLVRRWVEDFWKAESPGQLRSECERSSPHLPDEDQLDAESLRDAQELLGLCLEAGGCLDLDVLRRESRRSDEAFGVAVRNCLRRVLLYADLGEGARLQLRIWPAVVERFRRPEARAPESVDVEPEQAFCRRVWEDDLFAVLVECAADPVRLKAKGEPYARDEERLREKLPSMPSWLEPMQRRFGRRGRVADALALGRLTGFLVERGAGRGHRRLEVGEAGSGFLAAPSSFRARLIVEVLGLGSVSEEVAALLPEDDELRSIRRERARFAAPERQDRVLYSLDDFELLEAEALRAWEKLAGDGFLDAQAVAHHAAREENPLVQDVDTVVLGHWRPPSEERCEALWEGYLVEVLFRRLVPMGAVEVFVDDDAESILVRLSPVGRHLLGIDPELELGEAAEGVPICVMPTFEVLFPGPNPEAEASLSTFCERRGSGVGVLFEITRDSIHAAARRGMSGAEILSLLARAADEELPGNVAHEIRRWSEQSVELVAENAVLVRCPDAEVADRLLEAGGNELRRLGDTVVELRTGRPSAAFLRRLAKLGVFLEPPIEVVEKAKLRSRARRRRRSW